MRLSELYTSIQCEGPNVGRLTQFVRFAGCNLRCPLWPCDTQHAIEPSIWKKEAENLSPVQLVDRVTEVGVQNLCLTGGEPFMQRQAELQEFVEKCAAKGYRMECFSNGTFVYPDWALYHLQFIMDWKLPGSGEHEVGIPERLENASRLKRSDNIKFVCKDVNDLEVAAGEYLHLVTRGCEAQFWVGSAWDTLSIDTIIEYIRDTKLPWKVNVQVHKYLWDADKRGV